MQGFYLISGFFFAMMVQKYGIKKTCKRRLLSIGVPLIFVGVTFNTLLNLTSDNFVFISLYKYIIFGEWLAHLWFLGNLLIYFAVCFPFILLVNILVDKFVRTSLVFYVSFLSVPIITVFLKYAFSSFYGGSFLFFDIGKLTFYFGYFIFGVVACYFNKYFFGMFSGQVFLSMAILMMLATLLDIIVENYYFSYILNLYHSLFLVIVTIGFFNRFESKAKVISSFNSASYTIYLVHPIFINLLTKYLINPLSIDLLTKFLLLTTSCTIISFLFHKAIVDSVPLVKFLLNGKMRG